MLTSMLLGQTGPGNNLEKEYNDQKFSKLFLLFGETHHWHSGICQHCIDIPWRVVINECIELAKEYGGTDGHKYVNAVLNGLAPSLRALEVAADKHSPPAPAD